MTRMQFKESLKTDRRAQVMQAITLAVAIAFLGVNSLLLARVTGADQGENTGRFALLLVGAGGVTMAGVVVAFRRLNPKLARCPHCRSYLGGLCSQVVIACGRCGGCGKQLLDDDDD